MWLWAFILSKPLVCWWTSPPVIGLKLTLISWYDPYVIFTHICRNLQSKYRMWGMKGEECCSPSFSNPKTPMQTILLTLLRDLFPLMKYIVKAALWNGSIIHAWFQNEELWEHGSTGGLTHATVLLQAHILRHTGARLRHTQKLNTHTLDWLHPLCCAQSIKARVKINALSAPLMIYFKHFTRSNKVTIYGR